MAYAVNFRIRRGETPFNQPIYDQGGFRSEEFIPLGSTIVVDRVSQTGNLYNLPAVATVLQCWPTTRPTESFRYRRVSSTIKSDD